MHWESLANSSLIGSCLAVAVLLLVSAVVTLVAVKYRRTAERRQAEEALAKIRGHFEIALQSTNSSAFEYNVQTGAVSMSPALYGRLGYTREEIPRSMQENLELIHPQDCPVMMEALNRHLENKAALYYAEFRLRSKHGEWIWSSSTGRITERDARGRPLLLLGWATDITERKQLEEQFRQAQKMEAIGLLAGGVAHDFNNLLTVIQGHAGLLCAEPSLTPEMSESLQEIMAASTRATTLTQQLLAFGRRQVLQVKRWDLNEIVAGLGQMLKRLLGEHITQQFDYAPIAPWIDADAGMIEQAILNLAVNARDAMPNGGRLTIRVTLTETDANHVMRCPEAREGHFVCLTISDTGCGMDEEVRKHIFEPFFTTKESGRGTGLGLATVYGIVKQHQGWMEVDSRPSQGACFAMYLPISSQAAWSAPEPSSAADVRGGTETILVVEDETTVRQYVAKSLRRYQYHVFEASNGLEARAVWNQHRDHIDLVLTDMVMPEGVTGRELIEHLRAEKQNLKAIYSSGYSPETVSGELSLVAGQNYLPKPFEPVQLARAVRYTLDHAIA
jgi:two-component system, cell cycle sensor histidine kinase and response regulator CckA